MTIFFALSIVIFFCAYSLGKHYGRQTGIQEGKSSMLLELREQSLLEGCCFFCGARKQNRLIKSEDTNNQLEK